MGNEFGWWQCHRDIKQPGKHIMRFRKRRISPNLQSSFNEGLIQKLPKTKEFSLDETLVTTTKIKMIMMLDGTVIYNTDAIQLSEGSMLDELTRILPEM